MCALGGRKCISFSEPLHQWSNRAYANRSPIYPKTPVVGLVFASSGQLHVGYSVGPDVRHDLDGISCTESCA